MTGTRFLTGDYAHFIADRLRCRRSELEQAVLARVFGIGDPAATEDSGYLNGIRTAAAAAVDFSIATLTGDLGDEPPIQPIFLLQARIAARHKVRLDTVLRRYAAGHAILFDFLIEESEQQEAMPASELRKLMALTSTAFDRLILSVGDEYARQMERRATDPRERSRVERVERLLSGELMASERLEYPLDMWHIGVVVEGVDGRAEVREAARELDRLLLAVEPSTETVWAWLGGRAPLDPAEVEKWFCDRPGEMRLGLGEPGRGVAGWRLTHRQALTVFPLAEGYPVAFGRYANKGVLAAIQKDQVLVESLRKLYLEPLAGKNGDDAVLMETLGAYFAAECSTSSAAAALMVHRQTVSSRLRAAEERLGRSISECTLELSLALLLGQS